VASLKTTSPKRLSDGRAAAVFRVGLCRGFAINYAVQTLAPGLTQYLFTMKV
jgi:hypothetical protein